MELCADKAVMMLTNRFPCTRTSLSARAAVPAPTQVPSYLVERKLQMAEEQRALEAAREAAKVPPGEGGGGREGDT